MFGAACWSLVVAVNVWPRQVFPMHVSMTLRNGFIMVIVLGWLLFVLEYIHRKRLRLRPVPVALVLVVPLLTIAITATNPFHHLAIGPGTPADIGGGPAIEWGPWYLVFLTYAFLVSLVPAGLLVRDLRSAHGVHRQQLLLILLGFIVGFLGINDFIVTGAIDGVPAYVRTSPFAFLVAAGFWSFALFQHQLFGLVPVSRRTVVETIPDPVIAVDDAETIVDVNPAAKRVFDPPDSATGMDLAAFCRNHPELVDRYRDSATTDELTVDQRGNRRHFSTSIETVVGEHDGSIILLRDVTELKRREQQLERKNDQLERLSDVISHDLQTPLSTAEKVTQILRTNLEDHDPEVERSLDDLESIHTRLWEFVDHLPRLARESTDVEQPTACELSATATVAWNVVDTAPLALEVESDRTLEGDPTRLQQLFENLFRNVVEHGFTSPSTATPDTDGDCSRPASSADNRFSNEQRAAVATTVRVGAFDGGFFVADDGPGFPPELRDDLFEYGMGTGSGSGFGLAIVRSIVEAHGWDIRATDSSSGGARFDVYTETIRSELDG